MRESCAGSPQRLIEPLPHPLSSRMGWAGQHSDHPYSIFAHVGIKTVVPAMPSDGYGLLVSAIRDEDPTVIFAPTGAMGVREDVTAELTAVPLGSARIHRPGSDVTVVAVGHLVHDALAVAAEIAGKASLEIFARARCIRSTGTRSCRRSAEPGAWSSSTTPTGTAVSAPR
jgi:pyruvate/2-oxoglutarate/acetoin dehydrogenase E1 component